MASSRNILTHYFRVRGLYTPAKETRAAHPSRAILHAVKHMITDDYGAKVCEVWNDDTGELIATVTRSATGAVKVMSFLKED